MSAARPTTCLSRRLAALSIQSTAASTAAGPGSRALFHSSSAKLAGRRRSRFKSVHLDQMGLTSPEKITEFTNKTFPKYTPQEIEVLKKRYTPEQMAAIEAGEAAINPEDLTVQARIRTDPYMLPYLDDFSKILPTVDKRPQTASTPDPDARWMTDVEFGVDLFKWADGIVPEEHRHLLTESEQSVEEALAPQIEALEASGKSAAEIEQEKERLLVQWRKDQKTRFEPLGAALSKALDSEFPKLIHERSMFNDGNHQANDANAPGLGRKERNPAEQGAVTRHPADETKDPEGKYTELLRKSDLNLAQIGNIQVKTILHRVVTNQTRLGKVQSHWVQAIAGNGDGRLGVGEAKASEFQTASVKAELLAIQNLMPIARYEDRTIFGKVKGKFGATIVEIEARPPGYGLRAPHRIFEVFRMAGIRDALGRMPAGRNKMNSVKACVQALQRQQDPNELAMSRGQKFVDVRKVYFGGNVY